LRNVYQKLLRTPIQTGTGLAVIDGFGLDHEGDVVDLTDFFLAKIFSSYTSQEKLDMGVYMLSFDTGTAPAAGYTITLDRTNVISAAANWGTLESQAGLSNIDLEARGTILGQVHGLLYNPVAGTYQLDSGTTLTHAQLTALIQGGDVITVMGVYPGTGSASVGTIL
jgi:hypothetical protein